MCIINLPKPADIDNYQLISVPEDESKEMIEFGNLNGNKVYLERHRLMKDGNNQVYLSQRIEDLKLKHVPPTKKNLMLLGFSSHSIIKYRHVQRTHKRKREETITYVPLVDIHGNRHYIEPKPKSQRWIYITTY